MKNTNDTPPLKTQKVNAYYVGLFQGFFLGFLLLSAYQSDTVWSWMNETVVDSFSPSNEQTQKLTPDEAQFVFNGLLPEPEQVLDGFVQAKEDAVTQMRSPSYSMAHPRLGALFSEVYAKELAIMAIDRVRVGLYSWEGDQFTLNSCVFQQAASKEQACHVWTPDGVNSIPDRRFDHMSDTLMTFVHEEGEWHAYVQRGWLSKIDYATMTSGLSAWLPRLISELKQEALSQQANQESWLQTGELRPLMALRQEKVRSEYAYARCSSFINNMTKSDPNYALLFGLSYTTDFSCQPHVAHVIEAYRETLFSAAPSAQVIAAR
jgi:hypothetical protein